ncbi:hypothetical protein HPB48_007146 [Haemaphysalis longicornis]|uniref:XK-related protein n=1 Tax=Haemaphysalis longicornis TaxID=44386 RepID=A0A9J6GMF6_HAELO|nr:hypothetical protein HPB48_007146 [Haemaphysalis longicornis]
MKERALTTPRYHLAAQLGSVGSSLFELCWSLASYHRALRRSVPDKHNMSRLGSALQFFWRLGTVASRAAALALFASQTSTGSCRPASATGAARASATATPGGPRPCREYIFNMLIGAIYLFCFHQRQGATSPTRYKYSAYYVIAFLENTALIVLWYFRADPVLWYRLRLLIGVIGSFVVGITFMLIYYRFFHQTDACTVQPDRPVLLMTAPRNRNGGSYRRPRPSTAVTACGFRLVCDPVTVL